MSTDSGFVGFADRHVATIDIMKALKAYLQLSQAELLKTATEIEEQCLAEATSKQEYLQSIVRRKDAILHTSGLSKIDISTTTGVADEPQIETQSVGKYKAIYHEQSINATIYKAKDLETGEAIALKVVMLEGQMTPHDIQREAKLMSLVSDENVIKLLGTESIAGGLFALRLPFKRYDLASLAERNLLNDSQKRKHLRAIFTALAAVHEAGIIHRDIKPSNVLLDSVDGPAYLTDFGISWHDGFNADEPDGKRITDVGTGSYRPPELLFGCEDYGSSLDMWAIGCMVAEVLTGGGRMLFDAGMVTRDDFLGSDLTLLNSIFTKLGTPSDETWPEAKNFRDWGKIQFKEYPPLSWREMLPNLDGTACDLVGSLVVYSSSQRLTAKQALGHQYFAR